MLGTSLLRDWIDTVDGRNPAPPWTIETLQIMG
jgi:hypothetical protein